MKYLFIAEKPSVMREVQKVYRKHKYEIEEKIGGEIIFTALAGHVCGYAGPKAYEGWDRQWAHLPLPMMPVDWKIVFPNRKSKELFTQIVKTFESNHCDGIIVGTDADVEGNGIYYFVMKKAGWESIPTLRFFYNDLTDSALLKSFLSMTDFFKNPRDVHMTESFLLRSRFDWQMGMNMTVAASVKTKKLMKIGRVKAPTLKLIYDNHMAIENFVPKTVYQIMDDYALGFSGVMVGKEGKPIEFEKKEEAQEISFREKKGKVLSCEKKEQKTYAPKLFKLSKLQIEAGNRFGYSPSDVLLVAQSLYETHKVLSYPRTDGEYISQEKAKEIPQILKTLSAVPEFQTFIEKIPAGAVPEILKKKAYVNDVEVAKASHDALMPTLQTPDFSKMNEKEKNIYSLVVKRLLAILYPPLVEAKTTLFVGVEDKVFKSTGTAVVSPGWTQIFPKKAGEKDIPFINKGDVLDISKFYVHEKTSKPPKRLTEQSLVAAMENIASVLEEKEYKDVMKESRGIGTPATRGYIIDELKKMDYFEIKKKAIYLTPAGKDYIETLRGFDIINPEMTADMELHMKHVREGSEKYREVKKLLDREVIDMTEQVQNLEVKLERLSDYLCPCCGDNLMESTYQFACPNHDFKLPKRIAGVPLSVSDIRDLLEKGKTGMIRGFQKKDGKKFNACLVLHEGTLKFASSPYTCPFCGKNMRDAGWGLSCTGYFDKSCDFTIGYEQFGKKLTPKQIESLLKKGETGKIKGMKSRAGKEMEGKLYIDKDTRKIHIKF